MMTATITSEVLGAGKTPGSRQARRVGRPGQGIIDANRKTEICRHWMSGACPFGVKCAFAHGGQELRSLAVDAERTCLDHKDTATAHFPHMVAEDLAVSCRDPWCTACRDRTMYSMDKSRLLPSSKADYYRAPRSNGSGLDGFLLEKPAPSYAMDDLHLSMNRLRMDSQQTSSNKHFAHRGGMSRGDFSLWQSPDTMVQGSDLGCTETTGRRYKVDGEVARRAFDEVNTKVVRGEVPRCTFDEVNTRAVRGEVPRRGLNEVNTRTVSGEVPRRAFDEVNTRAVSGEVPRRVFDDGNKASSMKPVVPTTATAEAGLRGRIRERETWSKISRGGHSGGSNDPLRMQGNQYGEQMEAGCRSREGSRPHPRPVVAYEPRHDMSPRICDFSYFQTRRGSHRSASIPPKRSPAGRPASSASAALLTAGNTAIWDPVTYDAPRLGDSSTAFCEGKKKAAAGAGRANLTMQQRLDEDGTTAGMVSALLEIAKTRPSSERSTTLWCEVPIPPADEFSFNKRLDTAEMPRTSRMSQNIGTRYISESTRATPNAARESITAPVNNGWQPGLRDLKPRAPSPQVVRDVINIPPRPTLARGPGAPKAGTITNLNSSLW